jgi:DNA polymerase-1
VKARLKERKLFWKRKVCKTCRNGKKKRLTCQACLGAGAAENFSFNLASPKQLADVLYNGLRLPKRSRKGKVTTDEEALKSLLSYDKSGFVTGALRFAKLSTMREIYERLEPDATGHVHTVFNIAGAYTGRFSSSGAFYVPHSTNLQNLPAQEAARDPLFRVRDCFVPESGYVFVYADLSQAEARVSAALSGDTDLLDRWSDPRWDAHRWTASAIFNKPESQITDAERFLGKKCRHALNYGMGYNKFWREVNDVADLTGVSISQTDAKRIVAAYHALHPNLDEVWWNRVQAQVQKQGYMEAQHCGWKAPFWPRYDESGTIDAETLRAAIAWEPQHTIVHHLNVGMLRLFHRERELGHQLLLQGHDSVLLSVPKFRWRAVARAAKEELERPMIINGVNLTVPVDVSMSETNWSALKKVKV